MTSGQRFWWALLILLCAFSPSVARGGEADREYRIKAAYLYNFVRFVDWGALGPGDPMSGYEIGILGKDPFLNAFDPVIEEAENGRRLQVLHFTTLADVGEVELSRLHLLFVARSERRSLTEILAAVDGAPVLTVSDIRGFARRGGMIELVTRGNRVRFGLNRGAVDASGLRISSQVYRLALEVIEKP